ncbi:hypothetical protein EG329_005017 [Mollisiaceae sp. DMI_Dod_QoI]|nr:hypothetical protein EG329_005017 [Helotiales sp. DMI_Dod_QoI]
MGSASSRFATRWWEAKAQRKIVTTKNTGKVEVICSLIPDLDEAAMVGYLKKRSDLDTLFQNLSRDQHADPSNLSVDFKANELWRVLQMPFEYRIPSEIAAEFHATVCQAIFRVPFSDFVKYALGYTTKARFLTNLLHGVCDRRDKLRSEFLDRPQIKKIYIDIEKALKQQHHPLAHWIVASSLNQRVSAPYDAFAANFDQIKRIFATRSFDVVLKRLAALDRRFAHGIQMYNWQKWSIDLDFWQCVDGALWSGKFTTPLVPPHSSGEDQDKRLRFLDGFKRDADDKA